MLLENQELLMWQVKDLNMTKFNEIITSSSLYQSFFTLFLFAVFLLGSIMMVVYLKEKKPFSAGGNFMLALFCLFGVLVKFGLINKG